MSEPPSSSAQDDTLATVCLLLVALVVGSAVFVFFSSGDPPADAWVIEGFLMIATPAIALGSQIALWKTRARLFTHRFAFGAAAVLVTTWLCTLIGVASR